MMSDPLDGINRWPRETVEEAGTVNRGPVLTLWTTLAEVSGFEHDEALAIGRNVAGLNAYSKGVSLGLLQPTPREVRAGGKSLRPVREIQAGNSSRQKRMRGLRQAGPGPHPQDGFSLPPRSVCPAQYLMRQTGSSTEAEYRLHLQQFISGFLRRLRITERNGASQFNR